MPPSDMVLLVLVIFLDGRDLGWVGAFSTTLFSAKSIFVGSSSGGPGVTSSIRNPWCSETSFSRLRFRVRAVGCGPLEVPSSSAPGLSVGSSNNSLMSPLINPESVLGIGGKMGLDGQMGVERTEAVCLRTGGDEEISGGVSAGLSSFSGEVIGGSIDGITWFWLSSPISEGEYGALYGNNSGACERIELRLFPAGSFLRCRGGNCGTGVGALGTSCKWDPVIGPPLAGAAAIGLNKRKDPAVLAATLKESDGVPNDDLLFQCAFETVARLFAIGASSPSVPSS